MERINWRILVSVLLIGLGVVMLLGNLNLLPFDVDFWQWTWMALFGLAGAGFLLVFGSNTRENWWAAIPGFTLLGLAGLIGLPPLWSELGGAYFLGMIGLSFWVIYAIRREFWWAIIPGGVLLTLAGVAAASTRGSGIETGGYFFLGLAATFLLVFLLPTSAGRMSWAIWPAGALGTMGLLLVVGESEMAKFIWPLALILVGGLLVLRNLRPGRL